TFTFYDPLLDNMMSITPVEQWRKIRPAASPAFSTGKLRKMNSLIEDCAVMTAEHLKKAASNREDIDVKQLFGNYTLDVIARCAFATRLDSHSDQTNEFVTRSRQAFSGRITPRLFLLFVFPSIAKMLRLRPFNSDIFLYFKQICQNIIKGRQDQQSRHEDFLQLMMDAQEGNLASTSENTSERDNQLFNLGSDVKPDTSFSSNKSKTISICFKRVLKQPSVL
ncbi:cytochrome P450 3A30-like, partial [Dermacentor silvarum]|uniref:cytochrome P450 3A30-like n=1 Tax=Dermacentor silvarum TaxID=543639 RepID=UPI002101B143